eukprot:7327330-Prymnesium_polylepis.1
MAVIGFSTLSGWPFALRAVDDPHVKAVARACGRTPAAVLLRHSLQYGVCLLYTSDAADDM